MSLTKRSQFARNSNRFWSSCLRTLLWVRLGQELGSQSELAQAVASGIDAAIRIIGQVVG